MLFCVLGLAIIIAKLTHAVDHQNLSAMTIGAMGTVGNINHYQLAQFAASVAKRLAQDPELRKKVFRTRRKNPAFILH